jgi:hypothetical protein
MLYTVKAATDDESERDIKTTIRKNDAVKPTFSLSSGCRKLLWEIMVNGIVTGSDSFPTTTHLFPFRPWFALTQLDIIFTFYNNERCR